MAIFARKYIGSFRNVVSSIQLNLHDSGNALTKKKLTLL